MKFTMKVKLMFVFAVFFVTAVVLGSLGIYSLMRVNEKTGQIVNSRLPGVSISRQLNTYMSDYRVLMFRHIGEKDPTGRKEIEKGMDDIEKNVQANFKEYDRLIAEASYGSEADRKTEQARLDDVKNDWKTYLQYKEGSLALGYQNKSEEALAYQKQYCAPVIIKAEEEVAKLVQGNEQASMRLGKEVDETYDRMRLILGAVVAVALVLGSLMIVWIERQMVESIEDLLHVSKEIADGNLNVVSKVKTRDELGELAKSSNRMVESMKNLITQIQRGSEQLAASSEELTASADQSASVTQNIARSIMTVSGMTMEQVDAVNAATGHMEAIAVGIESSSSTLQLAAAQTRDAVETARMGTRTIEGAVGQMQSIESTVGQLATVVEKLGDRSKEIGQIVVTISGIAGQTNLLALNAAIEAARAGEQGRGFAVVAEEVRKLAEQSQDAAKEIEALITEIQTDTEHAVTEMDRGTREVKTGAGVVRDAGEAFAKIYDMVDLVNRQAVETAVRMEELAQGTQRVAGSIQRIDLSSKNVAAESQSVSAATEEQSASMQEIAASSRSLAQLAQELTKTSAQFRM